MPALTGIGAKPAPRASLASVAERPAHGHHSGGVIGGEGGDFESVMYTRVQRAIMAERKALAKLGQSDENEREQCPAIPRIIEQDVKMVERILV